MTEYSPSDPLKFGDPHPRSVISVLDSKVSYVDVGQGDPIVFLQAIQPGPMFGEISFPMQRHMEDVLPRI